jgi:hypothetical protein
MIDIDIDVRQRHTREPLDGQNVAKAASTRQSDRGAKERVEMMK